MPKMTKITANLKRREFFFKFIYIGVKRMFWT
jgi:hypothetical protein